MKRTLTSEDIKIIKEIIDYNFACFTETTAKLFIKSMSRNPSQSFNKLKRKLEKIIRKKQKIKCRFLTK